MISVIVPVFNAVKYIDRCIKCLNRQTLAYDELVLVDDGSIDGTGALCDEYAGKDSRIRVIHQQNQGASIARRVGISVAIGDILAFMDCDDYVEPDYLERLMSTLIHYGVDIAACDPSVHREGESVLINRSEATRLLQESELQQRFFHYDFWGFWGKLYRRKVFDDVYFPDATINEDYVVMAQLFHKYQKMAYVPIPLYHYLTHDGSLSNTVISLTAFDEYFNKKWVTEFYKTHNPVFQKHAAAQLTETCIKLCQGVKMCADFELKNSDTYKEMIAYLRNNSLSILFNPHLLMGLKIMAIKTAWT